jgi:hypothetical protein
MRGNFWLAEDLFVSLVGLCPVSSLFIIQIYFWNMKPKQITLDCVSQLTCLVFTLWKKHCRFYGGIVFNGYFRSPPKVQQNKELVSWSLPFYYFLSVFAKENGKIKQCPYVIYVTNSHFMKVTHYKNFYLPGYSDSNFAAASSLCLPVC